MSDGELQVRQQKTAAGVVVTPVGEIDMSQSPVFRHELSGAQRLNPETFVVDLAEVPYMDSSGVATLVEALQIARQKGTRLVLCGLQQKVRSIFEISRLDSVFNIADDVEAAFGG